MLEEKEHLLNNSLFDSSFAQGDQTKCRAAQTADLEETQRPKKKNQQQFNDAADKRHRPSPRRQQVFCAC